MSIFRKPIKRTRSGTYEVNLDDTERTLLRVLPGELRAKFANPDDPDLRRLFPPAYSDDEDRDDEYQRLMQDDLVSRHGESLQVLEQTAEATELSEEQTLQWLNALNQVRLVLGTRLDVSEDDDPSDPGGPERQAYYFLGALQELVIDALSG